MLSGICLNIVISFAKLAGAFRNFSYLLPPYLIDLKLNDFSREYAKEIENAILVLSDNFFSGPHPVIWVVRTAWVW